MSNYKSPIVLSEQQFSSLTRVDKAVWTSSSFECSMTPTSPPPTTTEPPPTTTAAPSLAAQLTPASTTVVYAADPVLTVDLNMTGMVVGRTYTLTHYLGASSSSLNVEAIAGMQLSFTASEVNEVIKLRLEHSDDNFKRTGIYYFRVKVAYTQGILVQEVTTNTVTLDYKKPPIPQISNVRLGITNNVFYTGVYRDYGETFISLISDNLAAGETYFVQYQLHWDVGSTWIPGPFGAFGINSANSGSNITATKKEQIISEGEDTFNLQAVYGGEVLIRPGESLASPSTGRIRALIRHAMDPTNFAYSNEVPFIATDDPSPSTTFQQVWRELNFATGQWSSLNWNTAAVACTALSAGSTAKVYPESILASRQWWACTDSSNNILKIIKRVRKLEGSATPAPTPSPTTTTTAPPTTSTTLPPTTTLVPTTSTPPPSTTTTPPPTSTVVATTSTIAPSTTNPPTTAPIKRIEFYINGYTTSLAIGPMLPEKVARVVPTMKNLNTTLVYKIDYFIDLIPTPSGEGRFIKNKDITSIFDVTWKDPVTNESKYGLITETIPTATTKATHNLPEMTFTPKLPQNTDYSIDVYVEIYPLADPTNKLSSRTTSRGRFHIGVQRGNNPSWPGW